MTFAYPRLLWVLLGVAALAAWWAWLLERKSRPALLFSGDTARIESRRPSLKILLARFNPPALKTLALVFLALALARPQNVKSRLQGLGQGIDILMVLDTSMSMSALDFDPSNRLDAAKETAKRFILGRAQDRIGLIQFGGAATLACPLTADYDAVIGRLMEFEPGQTQVEGTAIGDGMISGINHIRSSTAKSKVLILLTDGRSNTGLIDPVTAAKAAAALGIKVYAIGAATRGESVMPIDDPRQGRVMVRIADDLDEDLLSEIARLTGGKYFRATSLKELHEIYGSIDKLEKSKVKLPDIVSRRDQYWKFIAAALLLLIAESALSATWLARWP